MKVLVIGGTGIIGTAVVNLLKEDHEVITVGKTKGDFTVDVTSKEDLSKLLEKVGRVDSIISATGDGTMGLIEEAADTDFDLVLNSKVMGQVNIARLGSKYLNEGGSITLTSGAATDNPMPGVGAISMGVAAIDAFIKVAALELKENKRINSVSPSFVKETMELMGMDTAHGVSAKDTALAYKESVMSSRSGEVLKTLDFASKE